MKGLYVLAKSDFEFGKDSYERLKQTTDQLYLNKVAYFIQQAVEKVLKFELELHNITYPKTHDIGRLIDLCIENEIEVPEKISSMDREITMWCTATRYDCDFYVSKRHIEAVMLALTEWFKEIDTLLHIEE
ncbi:MAG: HEPN domain-containing protein [Cellulosilyticaceae bacterium]